MATTQQTLADITKEVSDLSSKIQSEGVSITDPKQIVLASKSLLEALNKIQPHINKAEQAFGNQKEAMDRMIELRNKLQKVVTAYS